MHFCCTLHFCCLNKRSRSSSSSSSSSSYYPASCYGVKRSLSNGPTLLCEVGRGRRSWGLGGRRTDGGAPNDVDGETGIHFEGGGGVTDASLFWGRGCEKLALRFPLINKGGFRTHWAIRRAQAGGQSFRIRKANIGWRRTRRQKSARSPTATMN